MALRTNTAPATRPEAPSTRHRFMNLEQSKTFLFKHHYPAAIITMLAATLAMFGDVLFLHPERVISWPGTDTYYHFVYWRDFGFNQMRQGNLPLWNPHLFSGTPYFGAFHSALLYPLNWIFMDLPVAPAINISIAAHVFLIGLLSPSGIGRKTLAFRRRL